MKILFSLSILLLILSCKQEAPQDNLARLRMPPNQQISIVTEDQMTGEENKISLKHSDGGILVYGIEEDTGSDAIPSYIDLVSKLIGGHNKKNSKNKNQTIPLREGQFTIIKWPKAEDFQSRLQYSWQNPTHPELQLLIKNENLKQVVNDKSELDSFIALNNWARAQWQPGSPKIYPPWNANRILQMIRQKQTGGFCGQYTQVLAQSLSGLGYNTRYLWLNAHFAMEVYSNTLDKWIILDPFYQCIFKQGDEYLNAYEVYKLLESPATNKEISLINSLDQTIISGKQRETILSAYINFIIDLKMDHLEENKGGTSYVLNYWKHSAMLAEKRNLEFDFVSLPPLMTPWPQDLYAKQNQSAFKVIALNDKFISFELITNTPFHQSFEFSTNGKDFETLKSNKLSVPIKIGPQSFFVRSSNSIQVKGPKAEFKYEYTKQP
jgi:hypothetical protein